VSVPEPRPDRRPAPGVQLSAWPRDVVELAAFRERGADLESIAASQGLTLPKLGACAAAGERLTLCVRPARWLLVTPVAPPGSEAVLWVEACAGVGAVMDLSGALAAFMLAGDAVRTMLARGCRLDLRPPAFPPGSAAATIMVQVPVTLAALESGLLLLTPATTARHLDEWLVETSGPFGLECAGEKSK
jgi:heterotetrameric sarcosine oxidase gamma subunit